MYNYFPSLKNKTKNFQVIVSSFKTETMEHKKLKKIKIKKKKRRR